MQALIEFQMFKNIWVLNRSDTSHHFPIAAVGCHVINLRMTRNTAVVDAKKKIMRKFRASKKYTDATELQHQVQ